MDIAARATDSGISYRPTIADSATASSDLLVCGGVAAHRLSRPAFGSSSPPAGSHRLLWSRLANNHATAVADKGPPAAQLHQASRRSLPSAGKIRGPSRSISCAR